MLLTNIIIVEVVSEQLNEALKTVGDIEINVLLMVITEGECIYSNKKNCLLAHNFLFILRKA